jgi:acyl-CoA synthetase (AMP-forming)/AMP-acid ligase II
MMLHPLLERFARLDAADCMVFDGTPVTYATLARRVEGWVDHLRRARLGTGTVVALDATYCPESCAALLALIEVGAIIVPLSGLPRPQRREFRAIGEVEAAIRIDGAGRLESVARTGRLATHDLYRRLREVGSPGLVLFSSGTTGRSKASVLDMRLLLKRYEDVAKPRCTLSFLNLDHIGGINTLLHTLHAGGTVVTVPERSAEAVFAAIARHGVQVLPTTPTFLNMVLLSAAHRRYASSSLELITYGTEPMPQRTLTRLIDELPHVRFKQTYGLSELGILPTRSRGDGTLWVKLGGEGFDHKIVDGILWIRSAMAMLGYLNAPAPFDDDGYFNTQDVVITDGDYVRILGRRSEIINVGGQKVYPTEVENLLLEVPNIADVTVSGLPSPITGMVVKATVNTSVPESRDSLTRRVREHCRRRLEPYKVPAIVEPSPRALHSDRMKKARSAS